MSKGRTSLYRYYTNSNVLLYIGISLNPVMRLQSHEHSPKEPWTSEIATINIEWFNDKEKALRAETMAIKKENPLHNLHKVKSKRKRFPKEFKTKRIMVSREAAEVVDVLRLEKDPLPIIHDIIFMFHANRETVLDLVNTNKKHDFKFVYADLPVNHDISWNIESIGRYTLYPDETIDAMLLIYKNLGYKVLDRL